MKKNIIITGTSRGIGYELVQLFAKEGHRVLALSRNENPVKKLNLANVTALSFDISCSESREEIREWVAKNWKKIDVLINNAGQLVNKPFEEITAPELEKVFQVNVIGVFSLLQGLIPFMKKNGHVVNISSMGGIQGSVKFPGLSAYSASKGSVITLTEILAEEYKEKGPSFNALALGAVQTEMFAEAFPGAEVPTSPRKMAAYIKQFSLEGHEFYNGKILQVANTTP